MAAHEKTISFRTSKETHDWITKRAKSNGRSVNSELEQTLKKVREESKTAKQ